jgi:hypothetical protein
MDVYLLRSRRKRKKNKTMNTNQGVMEPMSIVRRAGYAKDADITWDVLK